MKRSRAALAVGVLTSLLILSACSSDSEAPSTSGWQSGDGGASGSGGSTSAGGTAGTSGGGSAGGASDGGDCVDVDSNPLHCGECGHDCLGGACHAGKCQPVQLASSTAIEAFAVGLDAVYWLTYDDVMMVPKAGGTPASIAPVSGTPQALVVDANHVYWETSDAVSKVSVTGGAVTTLASAEAGHDFQEGLAIDATSVYYTTYYDILRMPLAGGTASTLAGYAQANEIAVGQNAAYWTRFDGVHKIDLTGENRTVLVTSEQGARGLCVDATSVYWAASGGSVMKVDLMGGTPVTLASGQGFPSVVAVDSDYVYFDGGDLAVNTGTINKIPLDGGTPAVIASQQNGPRYVAVDNRAIYWANINYPGTIMKLAK